MPFFAIQNFRFGLDLRRSEYTSNPGTLLTLNNCVVNEGGEIEKRLGFGRLLLPSIGAGGTTKVLGLVAGTDTLYVFGSDTDPFPRYPVTLFGITVTYIRCIHPDGTTPMTAILSGTTFAGLPYVVAQFADGNSYPYYNGTLIRDFTAGLVLASLNTNAKLGADFASLVNLTSNPAYTANDRGAGVVDVFNQPNPQTTGYNVTQVPSSGIALPSGGILTNNFKSAGSPAVTQGAAAGQFSVLAGTAKPGTNSIASVKVIGLPTGTVSRARSGTTVTVVLSSATGFTNGDTIRVSGFSDATFNIASTTITSLSGSTITYTVPTSGTVTTIADIAGVVVDLSVKTEIMNVAVDWVTSNEQTAINIAAQINAYTPTAHFSASASSGVVNVYTTQTNAGSYNGLGLQITATSSGDVCVGDCLFSPVVTGSFTFISTPLFTSLLVNGIELLNGYTVGVTAPTTLAAAVQDIVNYINAAHSPNNNLYNACVVGTSLNASIRLSSVITTSNDTPLQVTVTPSTNISVTAGNTQPLVVTVAPTIIAGASGSVSVPPGGPTGGNPGHAPYPLVVTISGGIPGAGYTHNWQALNAATGGGIRIEQSNTATPYFYSQYKLGTVNGVFGIIGIPTTGQFVDIVTDSVGNTATSNILTVIFT